MAYKSGAIMSGVSHIGFFTFCYLDDFIEAAKTLEEATKSYKYLFSLLSDLGLCVSQKKNVFYLQIILDG